MNNVLEVLSVLIEPALHAIQPITPFEATYPAIGRWITHYGWIELGPCDPYQSLLRAFDQEGLVWESESHNVAIHVALHALDQHLETWMNTYYGAST